MHGIKKKVVIIEISEKSEIHRNRKRDAGQTNLNDVDNTDISNSEL